ncbi:MAG: SRPBCC family protein [Ornithinimicrobium sp.]
MARVFTVERSVTIDAPAEQIYPHVIDLRKWTTWSPWEALDPAMRHTYTAPDQGVGQSMAWTGNRKVGQGSMTITDATRPERVRLSLAFRKPFKATNTVDILLTPTGETTDVQWVMTGRQNLFLQAVDKVASMDDLIGKDFQRGLTNLKRVVEHGG